MWIITHIPSGSAIKGWKSTDKGFYSYKEAHKMLLTINRTLKVGYYLYGTNFNGFAPSNYLTVIQRLDPPKKCIYHRFSSISRRRRIYKLSELFEEYVARLEPYDHCLRGTKVINLLCKETTIRNKTEILKPINTKEFIIHYVN